MRYVLSILAICLYSISYGQAIEGNLLGHWKVDSIPGSNAYNNAYNEVWGLSVNGKEYAIIGSTLGTHFIDMTDPENLVEAFYFEGASSGTHIIHRDYHDFQGYLYEVADEETNNDKSTLRIYDISVLPEKPVIVYDSDELLNRSHNIFIDEASERLYGLSVKGGNNMGFDALRVYDISNPTSPVFLKGMSSFGGSGVGHVHDAFIKNDTAFLNCGGDGIQLANLADLNSPQLLSALTGLDYPESGYNHSGWPTEDLQYYYLADETWGMAMKTLDVTDPFSMESIGVFDSGSSSNFSIAHNQIVRGDYLFGAYYYDGLQIWDISDRTTPERIMYYPTSSEDHKNNYEGAWGVYPLLPSGHVIVSDMQEGLFIIENPANVSSTEDDVLIASISISPNPNFGSFKVSVESADGNKDWTINVLDITGRNIKQFIRTGERFTQVIELNFAAGVYLIEVNDGENSHTEKVIVEK